MRSESSYLYSGIKRIDASIAGKMFDDFYKNISKIK
jgi:hypothetical protein